MIRRKFLQSVLAGLPALALDWDSLPKGSGKPRDGYDYDAIVIGSGLGGLSCAAAFSRQGFKPLVLEKHNKPGGYATSFRRPGGFVFDVSLHSTTVGQRNGSYNLIPGFPEITTVDFVPHPSLYRILFPDRDIRFPQKNLPAYQELLGQNFPEEKEAIRLLFDDMTGLVDDIEKYSRAGGKVDMRTFPKDFPYLYKNYNRTWGDVLNARIENPKLRGVLSSLWGYFGLPPSRLSCLYYILPLMGYLKEGGYYPRGRSQDISNAFVRFIKDRGGRVLLNTKVDRILIQDHAAWGVMTESGKTYTARAVISNANAWDTFHRLVGPEEKDFLKDYLARMDRMTVSFSTFQVFLGLKKDLVREEGILDSEIFIESGYDSEEAFQKAQAADVESGGFGVTLYDNVFAGYSPPGKNTVVITAGQAYDFWQKYEGDYFKGNKEEYRREKERMADILVERLEKRLLPGLRQAIEMREVATPLTNLRYTGNYRGAVYGWDQTVDNSGPRRLAQKTPIKNLYLAGAWTIPGGGYGAVIPSGLQCFAQVMKEW